MKKNWFVLFILFAVLLAGCTKNNVEVYDENPLPLEPVVVEYYDSLGINDEVRKTAEAVYVTYTLQNEKKVTLRLPHYWEALYVIQENSGIDVYEKYNYDASGQWEMGLLWRIDMIAKDESDWLYDLYADPYTECIGANSAIIGTDTEYLYMLSLPTDVQSVPGVAHSWEYYSAAMDNKDKFIADFLAVNNITVNEKAPKLN